MQMCGWKFCLLMFCKVKFASHVASPRYGDSPGQLPAGSGQAPFPAAGGTHIPVDGLLGRIRWGRRG